MKILQISILVLVLGASCKDGSYIKHYNENGNLARESQEKEDGTLHGTTKNYIENKLFSEETYKDGVLNGPRKIFYADGTVEIIENYKNGILDGPYYSYHPNGLVMLKANYVDGKMQGLVKVFYDSGSPKEEVTFVDGEENGPFKEFYENGNIKWEGAYVPGKEEPNELGEIRNYNEEGTLIRKLQCDTIFGYNKCRTTWSLDGTNTLGEKNK